MLMGAQKTLGLCLSATRRSSLASMQYFLLGSPHVHPLSEPPESSFLRPPPQSSPYANSRRRRTESSSPHSILFNLRGVSCRSNISIWVWRLRWNEGFILTNVSLTTGIFQHHYSHVVPVYRPHYGRSIISCFYNDHTKCQSTLKILHI